MGGADTEADPAEFVGSAGGEVDVEAEAITGADDPAGADWLSPVVAGTVLKRITCLRVRSPYRGGASVGVKLT